MASMTCALIFAAQSHRKEASTRNRLGAVGLASTHQPRGQGCGAATLAPRRTGGVMAQPAPCQAASRWGATSSPIPDGRRLGISQTQPFRRLQLLSSLQEYLLNPDGHQRLLEGCKSQYYQGCNQLLLITPLLNICSAFCH